MTERLGTRIEQRADGGLREILQRRLVHQSGQSCLDPLGSLL